MKFKINVNKKIIFIKTKNNIYFIYINKFNII